MISIIAITITLFVYLQAVSGGFPAYNCASNLTVIGSISLVNLPVCTPTIRNITIEKTHVVLTQASTYGKVKFMTCSVTATHLISRCGKTIDTLQDGGFITEEWEVTRDQCKLLIDTNTFIVTKNGGKHVIEIPRGLNVYTHSFTSIGKIDQSASCEPGSLTVNGRDYDRPIRLTSILIKFSSGEGRVDYEKKKLILPSGVECDYDRQSCYHYGYGSIYWSLLTPKCSQDKKESVLIYRGPGDKITKWNDQRQEFETFVQVQKDGYDFQVKVEKRTQYVCGFLSHLTEHPRIFLTFVAEGDMAFPTLDAIDGANSDLLAYINSKIIYSMRHVEGQVDKLFDLLQFERCKSIRAQISALLTLAVTNPREFAYEHFQQPGLTAINRGEVIHIAKCKRVEVTVAKMLPDCYSELPVMFNNSLMFLQPRSHILTAVGSKVECAHDMMSMFLVEGEWAVVNPLGVGMARTPTILEIDPISYKFENMDHIIRGGLYSDDVMYKMQRAFLTPMEEPILTTNLISSIRGGTKLDTGYSVVNTFTEEDYNTIGGMLGWWDKFSKGAQSVGSWSGFIFMTILIIKVVLSIMNWILNFIVLRKNHGPKTALLTFWWDSLAHLILSGVIGDRKPTAPVEENNSDEQELIALLQQRIMALERERRLYPEIPPV